MATGVTVSFEEVVRELDQLDQRSRNAAPAMRAGALVLVAAIEDEIQTEGRGRWEPFAASTEKRGRAGGKLLQDTGVLANIQSDSGADFFEAFSPAPYAEHHRKGTKHMPRRDFTDIELEKVLEEVGGLYLDEVVR